MSLYLYWLLRKLKKRNKKRGSEIARSVIVADKCSSNGADYVG